jgi:hypothetical protein
VRGITPIEAPWYSVPEVEDRDYGQTEKARPMTRQEVVKPDEVDLVPKVREFLTGVCSPRQFIWTTNRRNAQTQAVRRFRR